MGKWIYTNPINRGMIRSSLKCQRHLWTDTSGGWIWRRRWKWRHAGWGSSWHWGQPGRKAVVSSEHRLFCLDGRGQKIMGRAMTRKAMEWGLEGLAKVFTLDTEMYWQPEEVCENSQVAWANLPSLSTVEAKSGKYPRFAIGFNYSQVPCELEEMHASA